MKILICASEYYPKGVPQLIGKMIPAKRKYNPFKKALGIGTGFPDFICWRPNKKAIITILPKGIVFKQEVMGVEAKSNGDLDKEDGEKCSWLVAKGIFSTILIASKLKEGRKIIVKYTEFKSQSLKKCVIMDKIEHAVRVFEGRKEYNPNGMDKKDEKQKRNQKRVEELKSERDEHCLSQATRSRHNRVIRELEWVLDE